nr:hypothetical protein [Sphingomonas jejuensis]
MRVLAAVPVGYAVASLWAMALARTLPGGPSEATIWATLIAFVVCAVAAMGAFAARSGVRAMAVLMLLGGIAAAIAWMAAGPVVAA